MPQTLSVLPGEYAAVQLPPFAALPGWALQSDFLSVTRTDEELSLVVEAGRVPEGVRAEAGWAALKLHGPFDFALTGILAGVLQPLAAAGVGIFALSTFNTDYVLVKRAQLGAALDALRAAGHSIAE